MPCSIATAAGTGTITFDGRYTPNTPEPTSEPIKSEHQMIGDLTGPPPVEEQNFGWGPLRLELELQWIPRAMMEDIKALFFSWDSTNKRQSRVQVSNGHQTWLCAWDGPWAPKRVEKIREDVYDLTLKFLVVSEVE